MAIDLLADRLDTGIDVKKFNALVQTVRIQGQSVLLMKPLTYMNESGSAVAQAVNFYHIDPSDILILHDDMDLPTGSVRIRASGSGGGQKGMKSIIDALKTTVQPVNMILYRTGYCHQCQRQSVMYMMQLCWMHPKQPMTGYSVRLIR